MFWEWWFKSSTQINNKTKPKKKGTPAWWLCWFECCPMCQKVCSFNPDQGTYGRQQMDVSLSHQCFSLSLLLPLSLKSIKTCPRVSIKENKQTNKLQQKKINEKIKNRNPTHCFSHHPRLQERLSHYSCSVSLHVTSWTGLFLFKICKG